MYKFGKKSISGFILLAAFLTGMTTLLPAVDQKDPVATANYVLQAIRVNDLDALYNVMDKDKKTAYTPFTPSKRDGLLDLVQKDQKKIGKRMKAIVELRQCTTLSGKQGVAAKVQKKGKEVFVIILSINKDDKLYYYEETLTLSSKLYKDLKAFK